MDSDAIWDRIGTIAERSLRAIEIRSRFAHTHARELADEVLREARRRAKGAGAGRARGALTRAPR